MPNCVLSALKLAIAVLPNAKGMIMIIAVDVPNLVVDVRSPAVRWLRSWHSRNGLFGMFCLQRYHCKYSNGLTDIEPAATM
jgi:hypothetical protein